MISADYLYTHDRAYNYLLRYFLPELSDPLFRQEAAQEIEENERLAYCRYMAAWLPYQTHYDQILQHLCDMTAQQTKVPPSARYTRKQIYTA